ncbi:respiratory nitrate reductase subunit gamma [Marinococcus halotolerans]|uniref:respiratory nitrate reductase subunit gamma n=1 Tax=Marinococcus halotolerans TaxID=301092 RepID=UPI0003B59E1E|nr:respiratory nitrate reductase subunit gamma [Marinococcus halotolerans]
MDIFWWLIFPYLCLTIMIVGTLYRFMFTQKSWAAPSTEFFEKKWLNLASPIFHYGLLFAFAGHVMGILIPTEFYHFVGISDHLYHDFAIIGGSIAGIMVMVGAIMLLIRKIVVDPIRIHATFADFFSVTAILIISAIGVYMTIIYNTFVVVYEYRDTISIWFRSIFYFQPQYELMANVPFIFKLHVVAAFGLFASIPFTRLVHFYSVPVTYPARAPQQYRSRNSYKEKDN